MPKPTDPVNSDGLAQFDYALSKQVPDMARGTVIQTNYGEVSLFEHDALMISRVVQTLLERQRSQLIQNGGE